MVVNQADRWQVYIRPLSESQKVLRAHIYTRPTRTAASICGKEVMNEIDAPRRDRKPGDPICLLCQLLRATGQA